MQYIAAVAAIQNAPTRTVDYHQNGHCRLCNGWKKNTPSQQIKLLVNFITQLSFMLWMDVYWWVYMSVCFICSNCVHIEKRARKAQLVYIAILPLDAFWKFSTRREMKKVQRLHNSRNPLHKLACIWRKAGCEINCKWSHTIIRDSRSWSFHYRAWETKQECSNGENTKIRNIIENMNNQLY